MQEYENECEYTPDFQEAMDDLDEYRESKDMLNRINKVQDLKKVVNGFMKQPNLKTTHDENCSCSYCDPVDERYRVMKDQIKDGREVHDVKHGEHCGCSYCRGDRLGTVEAENISLKQFSSKAEEREYLYLEEKKHINDPCRKFDLPTDTKSFQEMYSVWKKNLAGELEKEYTVASQKDLEELASKDIRAARLIKNIEESKTPEFRLKSVLGEIDDALYLKNKGEAALKEARQRIKLDDGVEMTEEFSKRLAREQEKSARQTVEEENFWRAQDEAAPATKKQLKFADGIPWSQPKTKLVLVYVGSGSQSKWDKIINKCKSTFNELQEAMPQCMVIYVPDVGAQEGQIRVETHDLS